MLVGLRIRKFTNVDDSLSSIISRIQEEISTILLQHGKKGVKQSALFEQCQLITNELNKCITDTPPKHEELTDQFIGCKEEIQEYTSSSDRNHLKDAQIIDMKSIIDVFLFWW